MIHVSLFHPDGTLTAGSRELLAEPLPEGTKAWIDIQGHSRDHERLLTEMGFHPLAVEDTFTLEHQPKLEEYDDFLFIIVRGIDSNISRGRLATLKLVCFLTETRLVTFHRASMRSVEIMRTRLRETVRSPRGGLPHLLYLIYEEMISHYFPVLEEIVSELEDLEVEIFAHPREDHLASVLRLRHHLSTLRQVMLPHRQIFNHLATGGTELVNNQEALYFRDVYDEVMRLSEAIDVQREQLSSVRDTYLSVISQRTNEVMKMLTVISAILLPMTVITGIYGMNFKHMPEIQSSWGYPAALGLMATVATTMLWWFRKKGWL